MSIELINFIGEKLNEQPTDSNFTEDRLGISVDPNTGKIYKVTISEWVSLLSSNNVAYKGAAISTTDPGTPTSPVFYSASDEATYTNFKDSNGNAIGVGQDEFAILSYDGTAWTKQVIHFPDIRNKISNWTDEVYSAGEQVNHNGKLWEANLDTVSTDIPGASDKWDELLVYADKKDTAFVSEFKPNKNIFDQRNITTGYRIDVATGKLVADASYKVSGWIPVDENSDYKVNAVGISGAYYDITKQFVSGFSGIAVLTTPANTAYIRFYVAAASSINSFQIELGDISTKYEPYKVINSDMLITTANYPKDNIFSDLGYYPVKNLFDKSKATNGYYVNTAGNLSANAAWAATDFIAVKASTTYAKTNNERYATYDDNQKFVAYSANGSVIDIPSSGVAYVRLSMLATDIDTFQFEKGDTNTAYEPYRLINDEIVVDWNNVENKEESGGGTPDEFVTSETNLFNKDTVTTGYYVNHTNGNLSANSAYAASDWIPVEPSTVYTKLTSGRLAFYDEDKAYISGILEPHTFTTPANCKWIRTSVLITSVLQNYADILDKEMLQKGQKLSFYEKYKEISLPSTSVRKREVEIQLPGNLYMIEGSEFDIYYRNCIKYSDYVDKNNMYMRVQKFDNGTGGTNAYEAIGASTSNKWYFTPDNNTDREFTIEIRIYSVYDERLVAAKRCTCHVIAPADISGKTLTMVSIGDSFTDGQVGGKLGEALAAGASITVNMIGNLKTSNDLYKDDAVGGQGFLTYFTNQYFPYRADIPRTDQVWDAGWGQGEANGWTDDTTPATLTAEQQSHGHWPNPFYNPTSQKFDFAYYMTNSQPSKGVGDISAFTCLLGLNDSIWFPEDYYTDRWNNVIKQGIVDMITSIHDYDSGIKIFFSLVTPQPAWGSYPQNINGYWGHARRSKWLQEVHNQNMLELLDTDTYRNSGVFIAPTNAHFNPDTGINQESRNTDKFDNTYIEIIDWDIHPNDIGGKYIADAMTMLLYHNGLV